MSWYHDMLERFDREEPRLRRKLGALATREHREPIYSSMRGRFTEGAVWVLRQEFGDTEGVTIDHPWREK